MSTESFIGNELAALMAPVLAMIVSQLPFNQQWKSKVLIYGHIAAFLFAMIALTSMLSQPSPVPRILIVEQWLKLRIDIASGCLIGGITLISSVAIAFSDRYLAGDRTRQSFLFLLSLLSTVAAFSTVADSLLMSFLCWNILSLTLWRIICLQPANSQAAGIALRHHLVADILLLAAMVLVMTCSGRSTFSELPEVLPSFNGSARLFGFALPISFGNLICSLLVMSFSIKSALFPFHRWLLATLEAPTPLSGLLHAGVVNVAAILAYRMMPLLNENSAVLLLWGSLAAISAVTGTLSASAQPDVKRKLVYSTVGQMGFMCLQCASGSFAFAIFHVLAHGLFKCHMFLQSGSAISEGLTKSRFAYPERSDEGKKNKLRNVVFLLAIALIFCCALLVVCQYSSLTVLSAAIAATAIFCALPAINRINLTCFSLFWLAALSVTFTSLIGSARFDTLLATDSGSNGWLLPVCLFVFATISAALSICRGSRFQTALYVHSLTGFYGDEMASALSNRMRIRQDSH